MRSHTCSEFGTRHVSVHSPFPGPVYSYGYVVLNNSCWRVLLVKLSGLASLTSHEALCFLVRDLPSWKNQSTDSVMREGELSP